MSDKNEYRYFVVNAKLLHDDAGIECYPTQGDAIACAKFLSGDTGNRYAIVKLVAETYARTDVRLITYE